MWTQWFWKINSYEETDGGVWRIFWIQCITHHKVLFQRITFYEKISVTYRQPRPGEEDGKDYHYVTRETMQQLIDDGQFIENAEFRSDETYTNRVINYF